MTSLTIVPSRLARFGWCAFGLAMAVFLTVLSRPWQPTAYSAKDWMTTVFALVMFLGGIELPWRKVVIDGSEVRERRWFHWRAIPLPAAVIVGRDRQGRIAIGEPSMQQVLFWFGREFGRPQEIEDQLVEFFRRSGRLDGAAHEVRQS
jgi:hypothetical protein